MEIVISLIVLIFSVILHELAHGLVADRLGDPTPRLAGRLTLNPRPHIDNMMSIILPLLLIFSGSPIIIGGAKPMPVDPFNLKDGRKDIALVALSGPAMNLILAIAASIFLRLPIYEFPILAFILMKIITINLMLAIFNLLPMPPLDGSKVFAMILPKREANAYLSLEKFGMMIIFFLLLFPIAGFSLSSLISTLLMTSLKILLP